MGEFVGETSSIGFQKKNWLAIWESDERCLFVEITKSRAG
jgi:hypothetical protein